MTPDQVTSTDCRLMERNSRLLDVLAEMRSEADEYRRDLRACIELCEAQTGDLQSLARHHAGIEEEKP